MIAGNRRCGKHLPASARSALLAGHLVASAGALDDSTCSLRDEPGCLRFDVLPDNADPNRLFFYEVYRDQAAFEAHQASAHYPRWRAAAAEVLTEPTSASRCTTIFPRDYGWLPGASARTEAGSLSLTITTVLRQDRRPGSARGYVSGRNCTEVGCLGQMNTQKRGRNLGRAPCD